MLLPKCIVGAQPQIEEFVFTANELRWIGGMLKLLFGKKTDFAFCWDDIRLQQSFLVGVINESVHTLAHFLRVKIVFETTGPVKIELSTVPRLIFGFRQLSSAVF